MPISPMKISRNTPSLSIYNSSHIPIVKLVQCVAILMLTVLTTLTLCNVDKQ